MCDLEELKQLYPIHRAWLDEGLPQSPGTSCHSPFREDKHKSFSVFENGILFKDFSTNESGDVFSFIQKARNCSFQDAVKLVKDRLGLNRPRKGQGLSVKTRISHDSANSPTVPQAHDNEHSFKLTPLPHKAREFWKKECAFLLNSPALLDETDRWRCWPKGTARALCERGLLTRPDINNDGRHHYAFLVQYPVLSGMIPIGFHVRLNPINGDRAKWIYLPNEKNHKRRIPALPFVISNGQIHSARRAFIFEGQWDAISFAALAGWLHCRDHWPSDVLVMGIPGANNWKTFLKHYDHCWPSKAKFLLVSDNDPAGLKWRSDFAHELSNRSHSVTVLTPKRMGGVKDFSDMNIRHPFTSDQIEQLLIKLNMTC